MQYDKMIDLFVKNFGNNVIINSEYHVQIISDGKKHDVYINKHGETSFKLHGSRKTLKCGPHQIISVINSKKRTDNTDFDFMANSLNVNKRIKKAFDFLYDKNLEMCCFADAGFKDGKARIASIFLHKNGDYVVKSKFFDNGIESSTEAEKFAISMSVDILLTELTYEESLSVPIFTDSRVEFGPYNVIWIPRNKNKAADKLANLRK